jgi:Abortive infection C-terminus
VEHRTAESKRGRLAKEISEFWYGGSGPSHGELEIAFAVASVDPVEGSKRARVANAIQTISEDRLFTLLNELVDVLRRHSLPTADAATLKRLRSALRSFGFNLNDEFELSSASHPSYDHLPDIPELRDHVDRIQRALRDEDQAQLLGSTKELLETIAKVVLAQVGLHPPAKFPALLTAAFETLQIHPKTNPAAGRSVEEPVRKILGGVLQIVMGIDELRNTHGTGHGRADVVRLSTRHARLAAGAGITAATLMLDTLDDPNAPWHR